MAARSRGQKIKADVQTRLLKRINVLRVLPARSFEAIFYEILHGLEFAKMDFVKQMRALNYAACWCHKIHAYNSNDYECAAVIQRQLTAIENGLIDKSGKKTDKESELETFLADLNDSKDF